MFFAAPHCLWLLLLAPAAALLGWRRAGPRRLAIAMLRGAAIAVVALALARPTFTRHDGPTVVAVVDLTSEAAVKKARTFVSSGSAIVAFASRAEAFQDVSVLNKPEALAAVQQRLSRPRWSDDAKGGGANLADALRLAAAQIPAGGQGAVRLFSAGRNDHGDAAAEAWRLAQRGIAVTIDPAEVTPTASVRIASITVPASGRIGQTVQASITLDAAVVGRASVRVALGDAAPVAIVADVLPGVNRLTVDLPLIKPGLAIVGASAWTGDGPASDDVARAAIDVGAASNVLLVQDAPDAGLADALNALLGPGASVTPITPGGLADHPAADADVVVLADVPADHLPAATQSALREAVLSGAGLLLTGAARSFGPGGYDDSSLASLLPVRMPQQMESVDPSTTLVLIIDTSGSMRGAPIDLAKAVARLAISHLKPHDKVGICEFYGGKRWAVPIQTAANLSVVYRALDRLTAGGGTTLYPAVEEAAFALRNIQTRGKHVLILSDGFVESAPYAAMVGQMADDGEVVSTVQVVADDDSPNMMPDIARWGNGHFYVVPDQYALPDISLKQPQTSLTSPLVLTASAVTPGEDPLVRDVAAAGGFGEVEGYVRTKAKPTADVLLKTAGGDPLLARWRYGAGFVAALPTQLGSALARRAEDRPAFSRLLSDVFRQLGSGRGAPLSVRTTPRPAGIEVDVATIDLDPALVDGTIEVTIADPADKVVRVARAEAVGAGHWNVLLPDVTAGAYAASVTLVGSTATGRAGVAVAPPSALVTADRSLLDQVASFESLARDSAAALPAAGNPRFVDAQPVLAALAAILLLSNVAVRRWPAAKARSGEMHSS